VRDILYVDDLIHAMEVAFANIDAVSGRAFNMGGGAGHTTSLVELVDLIGEITGEMPMVSFDDWRPGDQRYYVSDTSAFEALTGWRQRVSVVDGVRRLHDWLTENDIPALLAADAAPAWSAAAAPVAPAAVGEL